MSIEITPQSIIIASALLAAIVTIASYIFRVHDWIKKQSGQDDKITVLEKKHDRDIGGVMDELQLLTYGVLSCLKGLQEKGCNGPVTEAINKIDKHLNEKAHH